MTSPTEVIEPVLFTADDFNGISRRRFLGLAGLAALHLATKNWLPTYVGPEQDFNFTRLAQPPLPQELRGVGVNSPFLWQRDPEEVIGKLDEAKSWGVKTVRIIVHDALENHELGTYNTSALDQLHSFVDLVEHNYPDMKLIVSFGDGFSIFHSDDKINFHDTPTPSPYVKGLQSKYDFFTDPEKIQAYKKRIGVIMDTVGHSSAIAAWEVMNEPEAKKYKFFNDVPRLTQWYNEIIPAIRQNEPQFGVTRPIIIGTSHPGQLDADRLTMPAGVVQSCHIYFNNVNLVIDEVRRYALSNNKLPIMCTEIGFPSRMKGVPMPSYLISNFVRSAVRRLTVNGELLIQSLMAWKQDFYEDEYLITDPMITDLRQLAEKFAAIPV